ncbi:transcriptional regulator [Bifidobacterium felsineum]|uniref:Transcriptional regulator n=1 Tax=Bifidobacterium felsineum TaxID=2045440 RepID=A0A2M9HK18_9BIFI|nr:transcriptional regulator [Bifidobacterium felsineum]MBT1165023.1 transcriptional regulator [Bifidobacterium felsineum]PJM77137.1 transcriptional regulator [Bifidobacterium felsineum]
MTSDNPQPVFNEVIHAPIRLRICGLLDTYGTMRFDVLRDTLEISDATCSKHLKTLAEHGYVQLNKRTGEGGKAYKVTWVKLTQEGEQAFQSHVAALRQIVAGQ